MCPLQGGGSMGKIFRISGNLKVDGEWREPDPSFEGEILVDDDDNFIGYCNELYHIRPELEPALKGKYEFRYLAGSFAVNERSGKQGICYYILSNSSEIESIVCRIPDVEKPEDGGDYCYIGPFDMFLHEGEARISLNEIDYSDEDASRIIDAFVSLDLKEYMNDSLVKKQFNRCKFELQKDH